MPEIERFGDWIVDENGLYNETLDYLIEAKRMGETRDGRISDWALHMIEKTWVDPEDFVPALKHALERFGYADQIDWGKTIRKLQIDAYEEILQKEAIGRLGLDRARGIDFRDAGNIFEEVERLKACAWRPRPHTSKKIKTEAEENATNEAEFED